MISLKEALSSTRKMMIVKAIEETHGNLAQAARLISMDRRQMRDLIHEYGLADHLKALRGHK